MARLIHHGLSLVMCSDSPKDYSVQDLKQFDKIKRYIVTYNPEGKGILLTEPAPNTQVDFNQFNRINESAAGLQGLQPMSKYTPSTHQDRKGVFVN